MLTIDTLVLPFYALIVLQKTFCIALTSFRKWFAHPKTCIKSSIAQTSSVSRGSSTKSMDEVATRRDGLHLRKNVQSSGSKEKLNNEAFENGDKGLEESDCAGFVEIRFGSFLDYLECSQTLRFVTHMDDRPMQSFHICKFPHKTSLTQYRNSQSLRFSKP